MAHAAAAWSRRSSFDPPEDALHRAASHLATLRGLRFAAAEIAGGSTAADLAEIAQINLSLAKILFRDVEQYRESGGDLGHVRPEEVICLRAVDEISDEDMMNRLLSYTEKPGADEAIEGYGISAWNEVRRCHTDGLLSRTEFETLRATVAPSGG